ncbi:MAG TPA: hypothetical protein VGA21_01965 [Cyclobacteriaceae bacterium]|jgi:hypothetical protein
MKDLAPDIFRKRMLIEGYYTINIYKEATNTIHNEVGLHFVTYTVVDP